MAEQSSKDAKATAHTQIIRPLGGVYVFMQTYALPSILYQNLVNKNAVKNYCQHYIYFASTAP